MLGAACAMNAQSVAQGNSCQPLRSGQIPADTVVYDTTQVSTQAEILDGPQLSYPDGPRQRGVQGRVLLSFIVNQDGRVDYRSIKVLQSLDPEIDRAAMRYASDAYFQPACLAGRLFV
jgi:TonB family protein